MKILLSPCHQVFDDLREGGERLWSYKIGNGVASAYPNSVIVTGFKRLSQKKPYSIVELTKGKDKIDTSFINSVKFTISCYRQTSKLLQQGSFDIMHHVLPFGLNSTVNPQLLINKPKIPIVIGPIQSPLQYHDSDSDNKNIRNFQGKKKKVFEFDQIASIIAKPVLSFLSLQTLKKADKIVVINRYTCNKLLDMGISEKVMSIIPPGIDTEKFSYTKQKDKSDKTIELLNVGYLLKRKGNELLVRAVHELIKDSISVRLTIIGDGPQMVNLKKLVKDLSLSEHVFFKGYVPRNKIHTYYAKSHIFVSMTRDESWGQMYLEALACGLPVITTRNRGSNEIIQEHKTGYLVDQEDYKDLAGKIKKVVANKSLLSKLSQNARKEAVQNYDWETVIIPAYLKVYSSLK